MDPGRALSSTTRLDTREHRSRRHLGDAERDRPIAEHHSVTDDHVGEQVRIVDPDHPRVARARPLLEPDESSGGERNAPVREASAADLRARQISEHGHWTAGGLRRLANHREPLEVLVELTVREIEANTFLPRTVSATKRILRGEVGQFFKLAMAVLFSASLRASAAILLRAPMTQRFLSFLSA